MLGLGSLLSAAASLRTEVQRLFSKLRGRSTYYENNDDSQASVRDTFSYGLLDKATIVLTPTATSDALVHSVKTYTGDELIDNGNFDTDLTGWSNANNHWQWTNQGAYFPLISTHNPLSQVLSNSADDRLKITFTLNIINGTANVVYIKAGGSTVQVQYTASGTYTIYTVPLQANTTLSFSRYGGINSEFYVNDISVVDVSSDFTFDRASSATRINSDGLIQDMQSITDPEFVKNGDFSQEGNELLSQPVDLQTDFTTNSGGLIVDANTFTSAGGTVDGIRKNNFLEVGKSYKLIIQGTTTASGGFSIGNISASGNEYGVGFGTHHFTATVNNVLWLRQSTAGTTNITSFSIKEVLQDWTFTGAASGYQELTANGIKMYAGSVSDANNALSRSATLNLAGTLNKTYKMEITASDFVNGTTGFVRLDGIYDANNIISFVPGTQTVYFKAYRNFTFIQFFAGSADAFITVKSISIKEVTFSDDVDLARINYDTSGQNGHILLEPTSTNLITYSEDLTQGSTNRLSVSPNATTAPDGTNTADKLIPNNTSSTYHYFAINSLSIGSNHTYSVFLKKSEYEYALINFELSGTSGSSKNAIINLNNGNIESTNFTSASVTDAGNGWYRCSVQSTASRTSVAIYPLPSNSTGSFTGDGTSGIFAWGIQLEALPYATSYIPTLVGSTVTRAAETLTGSGNTTLINSTEGVLFAEIAALANDGTVRYIGLNDSGSSNRVVILNDGSSNRIRGIVSSGGTKHTDFSFEVSDVTDFHKVAFKYKENDYALWIDGVQRLTATSGAAPIGMKNLDFSIGTSGPFHGKCKQLAVFNEALEDDELELLTGITNFSSFSATASGGGYTII